MSLYVRVALHELFFGFYGLLDQCHCVKCYGGGADHEPTDRGGDLWIGCHTKRTEGPGRKKVEKKKRVSTRNRQRIGFSREDIFNNIPDEKDSKKEGQTNNHQYFAVDWKVQEGLDCGVTNSDG